MMSWDPEYERPIMAASTDWIKAVVVDDFATLFAISESARVQKLPKFRILPLEALSSLGPDDARPPRAVDGVRTLGTLAGHVRCRPEHEPLREFLFGGVVLVRDRDSAISVSRSGHRAVTMSGEYFEPRSGTVTVDTGSKISRITKLISMSSDVDGLFKLISVVKRYIRRKKQVEKKTAESMSAHAERLKVSDIGGPGEDIDLGSGIVDVVLPGHLPADNLKQGSQNIADDGAARRPHMQWPGGIGGHVLDAGLASLAAVGQQNVGSMGEKALQPCVPEALAKRDVDEARTGTDGRSHVRVLAKFADDQVCDLARRHAVRPGQHESGIARKVAMISLAWFRHLNAIDHAGSNDSLPLKRPDDSADARGELLMDIHGSWRTRR